MKRLCWPALFLLLLGMALSACLPTSPAATRPAGEAVLTLAGGPRDPPTLDPALAGDSESTFVIRQIFGGLVRLNQNLEVVPDLASDWQVSPDGTVYTFTLNPEVRFHDGRPVTADDFIYSFERACDPNLSPYLPCGTYLNDIVGVPEKLAGQSDQITGLSAPDPHTLVITIDAPKAYFLAKLTYNTAYVVDRENIAQGADWTERPNGTGPFRLAEWQHDRRIVLARNEAYVGTVPQLEQVVILLGAEASRPLVLYEQGKLDFTEVDTAVVARLEYEGSPLAGELRVTPQLSLSYIGMNTQLPPLDDVRVRQALAMVLDRDKIARVTYEGRLVQAQGIVPPGMPGYEPVDAAPPYDPERARQLLRESRYGGPEGLPRITMYTTGGGIPVLFQQACRQELGIEIELRQVEWADYLNGLDERRYPLFNLGWIADYPDPQNFLQVLFESTSPNNYAAYSDPQVDRLLQEAAVEQDPARRQALYQEVERRILEDASIIPLTHDVSYSLTKPYVRGLEITPVGLLDLTGIYMVGP